MIEPQPLRPPVTATSKIVSAAAALAAVLLGPIQAAETAQALPGQACPGLYIGGTVPFTGLYPAIERRMAVSSFRPGLIVEIDVTTMPVAEVRPHVAEIQALPARVSTYLPGGHCNIDNNDCAELEKQGVRTGTTGSWNWDKDERRILNITHPANIARLVHGAEAAWKAGANYVRVDNIHNPAGAAEPRDGRQLKIVFDAIHDVEDRLRRDGTIPADHPTGVVAHNNLDIWEQLIKGGLLRRPPVFLTSERTAQLAYKGQGYKGDAAMKAGQLAPTDVDEITAGRRIALALGIPYTVAEFQISHDLGGQPGTTYQLPPRYIDELRALPGISDVIVIPSETHYVGRGKSYDGPGPRSLAAGPHLADAGTVARACLGN
jgi:hypothetical protein